MGCTGTRPISPLILNTSPGFSPTNRTHWPRVANTVINLRPQSYFSELFLIGISQVRRSSCFFSCFGFYSQNYYSRLAMTSREFFSFANFQVFVLHILPFLDLLELLQTLACHKWGFDQTRLIPFIMSRFPYANIPETLHQPAWPPRTGRKYTQKAPDA